MAVVRIDGAIYGGPETDSMLSGSSGSSSEEIMRELQEARKDPQAKAILIRINSPGGSVSAGMSIFDTMRFIRPKVNTICLGMAASMGAFLLAAGEKGKRYALPHSRIMIHQPLGGAEGQASDVEIRARQLLLIKRQMNELMAGFTGRSYDELVRDTDRDNFMSAQEALEYGLIDRVLTSRADL